MFYYSTKLTLEVLQDLAAKMPKKDRTFLNAYMTGLHTLSLYAHPNTWKFQLTSEKTLIYTGITQ